MAQALMLAIGGVLTALVNPLVGGELREWIPWFTQRLLVLATRRLPETQQERFAEEWISHMNDVRGDVHKVFFAWGCVSAAGKMAASPSHTKTNLNQVWKRMAEILRALKRSLWIKNSDSEPSPILEYTIPEISEVCEGTHVKVGPTRPDGKPHPHAGKTGRIARFINIYSDPYWLGPPSAMIRLDSGIGSQEFIWVSLASLETLPESFPSVTPSRVSGMGWRNLTKFWDFSDLF